MLRGDQIWGEKCWWKSRAAVNQEDVQGQAGRAASHVQSVSILSVLSVRIQSSNQKREGKGERKEGISAGRELQEC